MTASSGAPRRSATVSLDLDNEWAYLRTHDDPAWKSWPSYLPLVVPRMLESFARREWRITVFVVGQDAALDQNVPALRSIAAAGHEIGNHSLRHEPWLHLYSESEVDAEIVEAAAHIERATGQRPTGFRGPGFSVSQATLRVLARRGYAYDASTLPTFIGPLARAYYLATGKFSAEQRERLSRLYGTWRDGLRPLTPYAWRVDGGSLLELPVTTFPLFRVPIHLSYVHFLAVRSRRLALAYFSAALAACRLAGVEPSVLLHPLDFLGGDEVQSLRFFPAMSLTSSEKMATVERCFDVLARHYRVRPLREQAVEVAGRGRVRVMEPRVAAEARA